MTVGQSIIVTLRSFKLGHDLSGKVMELTSKSDAALFLNLGK